MFWKVSNLNLKNCIKSELSTPKRNAISIAMLGYLYGYDYRGIIGQTFFCRILYSSHYRLAALINVQVTKSTFEKERFYSVFALGRWMLCRMNSFSSLAVKKIILSPSLFSGRESSQGLLARAQPIQVHGGHQPASNVLSGLMSLQGHSPLSLKSNRDQGCLMTGGGVGGNIHTLFQKKPKEQLGEDQWAYFLHLNGISHISASTHCLLSFHWAPLEKSLVLSSLLPTFRCLYTLTRSPLGPFLLQPKQSQLSPSPHYFSLQSYYHLPGFLLDTFQSVGISLVLGSSALDTAFRSVSPAQSGEEGSPPSTCW